MGDVLSFEPVTWVYVICWRPRGPSKIGISVNPLDRLAALQVACPYKLRVWTAFGISYKGDAYETERKTLASLYAMAMEGEWVGVTARQAEQAILTVLDGTKVTASRWTKAHEAKHRRPLLAETMARLAVAD